MMADKNNQRKHCKRNSRLSLRHPSSKKTKTCDPDEENKPEAESTISSGQSDIDFDFIQQIEQSNLDRERKRDLLYIDKRSEILAPSSGFHDVFASARLLEQAQFSQLKVCKKPVHIQTTSKGFQPISENVNLPKTCESENNQLAISKTQLERICKDAYLVEHQSWEVSPIPKTLPKDLSTKEAILEDFGVNSPSPKRFRRTQELVQSPTPVLKTVGIKTYSKKDLKLNTSTPNRRLFDAPPYAPSSTYSSNSDRIDSLDESDDPEQYLSCPDTRIATNRSPAPDPNLSNSVVDNILNLSVYYSQTQDHTADITDIEIEANESVQSPKDVSLILSGDESSSFHGFGESITFELNFNDRLGDFSEEICSDGAEKSGEIENTNTATPSKDLNSFLQEDEDLFANFTSPLKVETEGDKTYNYANGNGAGISDPAPKLLPNLNGFSTAHGSRISISKTAFAKCSTLFDGEEFDDLLLPAQRSSETTNEEDGSINHKLPTKKNETTNATLSTCNGFSTGKPFASGNSDNNSKRKAKIFDDFDLQLHPVADSNDVQLVKVPCLENISHSLSTKMHLPSFQTSSPIISLPACTGFSTGRGTEIKMVNNGKTSIFSDIDLQLIPVPDLENCELPTSTTVNTSSKIDLESFPSFSLNGFATARGTTISISENAKRNIFDDFDMQLHPTTDSIEKLSPQNCLPTLTGFKTGLGSTIKVSNAAADTMKNIFENICIDIDNSLATAKDFQLDSACQTPLRNKTLVPTTDSTANPSHTLASTPKFTNSFLDLRSRKLFAEESTESPIRTAHNLNSFKTPAQLLQTPVNRDSLLHSITQEITASTKALLEDELMSEDCPFVHKIPLKSRATSVKPTRLFSRFNECTSNPGQPQATGNPPSLVSNEVQIARSVARCEQQQAVLNKNNIKPRPGALYLKKLVSRQTKWHEFTEHQKPSTVNDISHISKDVLNLTVDNVKDFQLHVTLPDDFFVLNLVDGITLIPDDHDHVGIPEMKSAFLSCPSIDPNLLHVDWITHHLSQIILKLGAMERSFPDTLGQGRSLNVDNVMLQLKYRYDREIDNAERSVLRKVLEKDDVPTRRMVLFVSKVLSDRECELSDGHYVVRTVLDQDLERIFKANTIRVGTKLMVCGAEMIGLDDGCFPLDIQSTVFLRISANSTRRVRWFTKLGLCRDSSPFTITLGSVLPTGGRICRLNVCIIRVYAMLYVDKSKKEGTGTALRSERVQKRLDSQNHIQLELIEKLYSQVSHEYDKEEEARRRLRMPTKQRISDHTDASQLFDILQNANDPEALEEQMTVTQKQQLRAFQAKQLDIRSEIINQRVREKISADSTNRKLNQLLKVKVIDAARPTITAMLSVWSPHESLVEMLRESHCVQLCNASASGIRYSELQLSAGRNSKFQRLPHPNAVIHDAFRRIVTKISAINEPNFKPLFNELDTVGLVVKIGHANSRKFQPAFLVDESMNVMCVNFWAGLKSFAYDDLVSVGAVLAVRDLQWRTISSVQTIPSTFATEFTTFTENPKSTQLADELNSLREFVSQQGKSYVIQQSLLKIESLKSAPKPKVSICSPKTPFQARNLDTSIANERLRTPTDVSPGMGQIITPVQRRIDKLSAYGEAPPLSPLVLNANQSINRHLGKGHRKHNSS